MWLQKIGDGVGVDLSSGIVPYLGLFVKQLIMCEGHLCKALDVNNVVHVWKPLGTPHLHLGEMVKSPLHPCKQGGN
jgi:hypothetical protein